MIKKDQSLPFTVFARIGKQKMSDLLADGITVDLPPFTPVGIDYFAPIEVKKGRSIIKRYGTILLV